MRLSVLPSVFSSHVRTTTRCLIATSQTWPSTAVLPAVLVRAGATVSTLSPGPLGLSGHVSRRYRCSRDPERTAIQLRDLVAARRFDWVIVADEPLLRELFEDASEALPAWLPVDPTDDAARELIISKHRFVERAAELEVPIPASELVRTTSDALEAARRIGYPVVLKGDRGFGGSEVSVCADARAVTVGSSNLFATNSRLVVQQYVTGFRASACVLYDRGAPAAFTTYRAECCYPGDHSASTVHESFEHGGIEPVIRAIGRATGFHGLAGIDFMCGADGTLYALEINPRPTIGFGGTKRNREFFAGAMRRLFAGGAAREADAGDPARGAQIYFPSYLFYFANHAASRDSRAWGRLTASLREVRVLDGALAVWEISRHLYDAFERRYPRFHASVQRARGLTLARACDAGGGESPHGLRQRS